jgi:hypothetical protein
MKTKSALPFETIMKRITKKAKELLIFHNQIPHPEKDVDHFSAFMKFPLPNKPINEGLYLTQTSDKSTHLHSNAGLKNNDANC